MTSTYRILLSNFRILKLAILKFLALGASQHNTIQNWLSSILDFVVPNVVWSAYKTEDLIFATAYTHNPPSQIDISLVNIKTRRKYFKNNLCTQFNFIKTSFIIIYSLKEKCNWNILSNFNKIDNARGLFYKTLYRFFDEGVHIRSNKKFKKLLLSPLFSVQIRTDVKNKNYYHTLLKRYPSNLCCRYNFNYLCSENNAST